MDYFLNIFLLFINILPNFRKNTIYSLKYRHIHKVNKFKHSVALE